MNRKQILVNAVGFSRNTHWSYSASCYCKPHHDSQRVQHDASLSLLLNPFILSIGSQNYYCLMAAMVAISVLLASLAVSSVAASAPSVIVTATSPGIDYAPANSWATVDAPGSAGSPQFLLSNADQGVVTFTFLRKALLFVRVLSPYSRS